jgi:nucleoside-diphosphate-sugar epimerase
MEKRETPHTMGKRIIVTRGSGHVGRHVIFKLLAHGHSILNLDLSPGPLTVHTIRVDLTCSGDVYNALSSYLH